MLPHVNCYVRDLIRRDRERQHIRQLIVEGLESEVAGQGDEAYFDGLRRRISAGS